MQIDDERRRLQSEAIGDCGGLTASRLDPLLVVDVGEADGAPGAVSGGGEVAGHSDGDGHGDGALGVYWIERARGSEGKWRAKVPPGGWG